MTESLSAQPFDPSKMVLKLRITLAADRDAVDPVVQSVMQVVREVQVLSGKEDSVELALTEALANAVVHGAKGDPSKVIECDVIYEEAQGLLIVVRDPGEGFDPNKVPNPLQSENVYSNHGRGVYLINQLMDEVKYERNGTEIHMRKK